MDAAIPVVASWPISVDPLGALLILLVSGVGWLFNSARRSAILETRLDERERDVAELRPLLTKVAELETKVAVVEAADAASRRDIKSLVQRIAELSALVNVLMQERAARTVTTVIPVHRCGCHASTPHEIQQDPKRLRERSAEPLPIRRSTKKSRDRMRAIEAGQLDMLALLYDDKTVKPR